MKLTKFGHSCIRLEDDGGVVVIDPGGLTEEAAVLGADAILVTHEHFDHFSASHLRVAYDANPGLHIWTVAAVAELLTGFGDRVHVVGDGDAFTAAGVDVEAHGSYHAPIHRDIPRIANTGFLVNHVLFHPGDALTIPDSHISTLMLPMHAPWSRTAELIDWVREVAPDRTIAVHDGALNGVGLAMVGGLLGENGPGIHASYQRLELHQQLSRL